jgi:hypothetical protein
MRHATCVRRGSFNTDTSDHCTSKVPMTTSKRKKKSSTSLRTSIYRPHAPHARTVTLHHNDNRTGSKTHDVVSMTSSETPAMLLPEHPEEPDHLYSQYIEDQTDIQHEFHDDPKERQKPKQRKRITEEWLTHRDDYLQEMLRHDGRGGLQETMCADCNNNRGDFSCYDCAYSMGYCKGCLVNRHRIMPLHRIRVWKLFFILS